MDVDLDEELVTWISKKRDEEAERLRSTGMKPIPLAVKNFSIVRQQKVIVNRIEITTNFDFDLVQQIMVSASSRYDNDSNVMYYNVLLFTDKPFPILLPYCVHEKVDGQPQKNNLSEWLFINEKGQRSRHKVDVYHPL